MQAKGQDVRAVVELGRFPGITIAVRKDLVDKVKSAADFKGLKIGVTAPGSSTALTAQYAMVKAGLKASDAPIIGVGAGASAVAAMKQKQVDIISHLDPVTSKLEADGDVVALIDTRTEAGTKALFGGSNPAAVLYLKGDFAEKNPVTTQKLVNAFVKALKWLETAKPDDVADLVPAEYHLGDKPLYLQAVKNSLESYSRTGISTPDAMKSMYDALKLLDPELAKSDVDLTKTFIDKLLVTDLDGKTWKEPLVAADIARDSDTRRLRALAGGGLQWPVGAAGWWGLALLSVLYGTAFTVLFTLLPRLGVVGNILASGADNAGYPNGRRPKDDVVDISLVAVMGGLCVANGDNDKFGFGADCKPANVPLGAGAFNLHDAVDQSKVPLLPAFPYLMTPQAGAGSLAQVINAAIQNKARFNQMREFFDDVGGGDKAGVWEGVPQERPEFRAETKRQVIKLLKKRKSEEMI